MRFNIPFGAELFAGVIAFSLIAWAQPTFADDDSDSDSDDDHDIVVMQNSNDPATATNQSSNHDNRSPYLGVNCIIALRGQFPSRSSIADPTIGEIAWFAGHFSPRGWAFCDGQLLPISQNTALFSILGTTYGGDGRTTFALPDMRGRSPVHAGDGPGLQDIRLGENGGSLTGAHTHLQDPHNHTHSAP